jgi:3-mercaptopyruvate sulfurtransferase SseA
MFGILAVTAGCFGLAVNQLRHDSLPSIYRPKAERLQLAAAHFGEPERRSEVNAGTISEISLEEFRELLLKDAPVVMDARPDAFYRRGHIPGALGLPRENFASHYQRLRETLERKKAQRLVIYCQGDTCEDSTLVAQALASLGHSPISLFTGGWTEWEKAGLPIEH